MKGFIRAAAATTTLVALTFLFLRSSAKAPARHANGGLGTERTTVVNVDAEHQQLDPARPRGAARLLDAISRRLEQDHPRKPIRTEPDRAPALIASFERMLAMEGYFDAETLRRDEIFISALSARSIRASSTLCDGSAPSMTG